MKPKTKRTQAEPPRREQDGNLNPKQGGETERKRAKGTAENPPRVFLKRGPDGEWRRQWVGRYTVDGRRKDATLCRWEGKPPETSTGTGDAAFERSREKALQMLADSIRKDATEGEEAVMVQRVHAIRYGGKVARVKIADLAARWDALPHKADLSEERRERVHSVLRRFRDFMRERFPSVTEAGGLTAEHFKAFLADVDADGLSARSWNDYLSILRGVLAKVDGQGRGFREYLVRLPKRTENTVHRRPFEESELDAIFAAAAEVDPELRPVLVAAACTALRRGDVARLRWDAVDMAEGFVTVKTAKTGETVEIPIFPPFRAVLKEAERKRKRGVPFVWPKIALAYARNADGLNWRLNRVLAAAGFAVPKREAKPAGDGVEKAARSPNAGKYEAPEDAEAAAVMVEDGMEREGWTNVRKAKGRRILALHLEGKAGKEIAAELDIARGAVSTYLHDMETAGKIALVSTPKQDAAAKPTVAEVGEDDKRARRGSLCGWHSFRTTFCTLALANGVPMELLQKITGHRTAEIVLKHYDRRGRDAMRRAIGNAMPKAIAGAVGGGAAKTAKKGKGGDKGKGKAAVDFEAVVLPPEVAGLLANASAADLEKVARMLSKTGSRGRK